MNTYCSPLIKAALFSLIHFTCKWIQTESEHACIADWYSWSFSHQFLVVIATLWWVLFVIKLTRNSVCKLNFSVRRCLVLLMIYINIFCRRIQQHGFSIHRHSWKSDLEWPIRHLSPWWFDILDYLKWVWVWMIVNCLQKSCCGMVIYISTLFFWILAREVLSIR